MAATKKTPLKGELWESKLQPEYTQRVIGNTRVDWADEEGAGWGVEADQQPPVADALWK